MSESTPPPGPPPATQTPRADSPTGIVTSQMFIPDTPFQPAPLLGVTPGAVAAPAISSDYSPLLPCPPDTPTPEETPLPAADPANAPREVVRYFLHPTGARRLVESLILFLGVILFLRSSSVEPFGVPTGSMAPTLTGDHLALECPHCGMPIRVGQPVRDDRFSSSGLQVECPNCAHAGIPLEGSAVVVGDRLLVDKNTLGFRRPHRGEVVTFWCPVDSSKPYVKRIAGLPGESILLQDGDVWIDGSLCRKSIRELRECLIPVHAMQHVPPEGWGSHWVVPEDSPAGRGAVVLDGGQIRLQATRESGGGDHWIEYVHRQHDDNTRRLEERPLTDQFVYNPFASTSYPVHDFHVAMEVEVLSAGGELLVELNDGRDRVTARLALGAANAGQTHQLLTREHGVLERSAKRVLGEGGRHRVEMAFADRRITVQVDGRDCFEPLDLPAVPRRNDVSRPLRLGTRGGSAVIRKLRLSRDVFYRPQGENAVRSPWLLGGDEYFMLGDNSGNSDDSRTWRIPGVPGRDIFGKPFLLHQPSKRSRWSLGGREVEFSAIDWSRIRWLR